MNSISEHDRVLVSPLGWGLGHATRLISVIDALLAKRCSVVVGGDIHTINLLQSRFPEVKCFLFPSLNVKLSKRRNQVFPLARIAFALFALTVREHKQLRGIIKSKAITVVISDNRYGLYAKGVKSILITHQLSPIFPKPFGWLEPVGRFYIKRQIKKFNSCWIPDIEGEFKLTGRLTRGTNNLPNAQFVGLLSRFSLINTQSKVSGNDLVAVISGPPPQRELFERELILLGKRLNLTTLIVQGLPHGAKAPSPNDGITLVPHLDDESLAQELLSAKYVICRAGYSTIMDLLALGRSALLVPTPGQTEQEYLAKRLHSCGIFGVCTQEKLMKIDESLLIASQKTPTHTNHYRFFGT